MKASTLALALAVAVAASGVGTAMGQDALQVIEKRQGVMKQQGRDLTAIKAFLDNKGDQAAAQAGADDLLKTLPQFRSSSRKKLARPIFRGKPVPSRRSGPIGASSPLPSRMHSPRHRPSTLRSRPATRRRSKRPLTIWAEPAAAVAIRRSASRRSSSHSTVRQQPTRCLGGVIGGYSAHFRAG